ncbi:hypothetical protein [Dactylosporangium sp. NPDC005555]|uniref:hypothetical protein n=1 Tax=Dactylosporangium sp. NPDC005555 TaxID=3154889 RepID=UPI0033B7D99A
MDQLTDALRRLDPPPAPSGIDLDAVVRRAHRHRARTRLLTAVAAAAVAAVAAVPLVADRHQGNAPAGRAPAVCEPAAVPGGPKTGPSSTEAEEAAGRLRLVTASQLTMALDGPLRQALPGATLLDAATCAPGFTFHADEARFAAGGQGFTAGIVTVDAAGAGRIDVRLEREAPPAARDCDAGTESTTCEWATEADGTVTFRSRAYHGDGIAWYDVDVYRPDGVHVHMSADNVALGGTGTRTRVIPPLDDAALLGLSRIERLTL